MTITHLRDWMIKLFSKELKYLRDFQLLGFEDFTDPKEDEGLTWCRIIHTKDAFGVFIFFYQEEFYNKSYCIDLCLDGVTQYSIFETDDMGELWSMVKSNLNYFNSLIEREFNNGKDI